LSSSLNIDFPDYNSVQDYLFSLKAKGVRFGIDRMRLFAAELGNPQEQVPAIHITGTNGKGSTAAMLDSILRASGRRCGLYTSPHLVRLGERVQVDRVLLTEAELSAYTRELRPLAAKVAEAGEDMHPTFFEFMTAMAFLQFARRRCELSIIEVGMGGLLDATNVLHPEVSVITSISLDHCEMLGDSVAKIAVSKAGIIKPGRPVVIGLLPPEAEQVVRARAAECGAQVISVREEYGDNLDKYPLTNLEGDFQRWNAATATLAARCLSDRWRPDANTIAQALLRVDWPGRWQRSQAGGRKLILDASHNPEGAQALEGNLRHLDELSSTAPVVVTGVLGASRAAPLLETIARHAREIHLVVPSQSRACSYEELERLIPKTFKGRIHRSTVETLFPGPGCCEAGAPGDTVLVTGSIYLLGEVLSKLEPRRGPIESRLQDF